MEPTGMRGKQRYVIIPANNVWNPDGAGLSQGFLDAASQLVTGHGIASPVMRLDSVGLPAATSAMLADMNALQPRGRHRARIKVLDSVAPNESTLVEVSEGDRQAVLARYPGLRIVPEIGNDLAWQLTFLKTLRLAPDEEARTAGASYPLEVRVVAGGAPLRGAVVAAVIDFDRRLGVTGVTDAKGRCLLKLPKRSAKLQALIVTPSHSYWPMQVAPFRVQAGGAPVEFILPAIDLSVPDARRLFIPDGDLADGRGVKVAVVDGGVDRAHPDLVISKGAAFALGLAEDAFDDNGTGHGTHVAGVIAGRGDPGMGVRGIAPACELHAYRVFGGPGEQGSSFAIAKAIRRAVDEGVDLINLSLGSTTDQPDVMREILRGRSLGTVCVVAVGNDRRRHVRYPSAYPSVIGVAALGIKDSYPKAASQLSCEANPLGRVDPHELYFASFSNMGSEVDLIAPGVGIVSTYPQGRYAVMDGTSMACPIVTGVIARELARHPAVLNASRDQVRSDLIMTMALTLAERCKIGFGPLYEGSGALR